MKKIKLLSKVQLAVLKFLGFFIPYIKRKMERATILNAINQMMIDHGKAIGLNVQPATQITSNMNYHKVSYSTKLTSGYLIIELIADGNSFKVEFDDAYTNRKNPTDYLEVGNTSTYFDKNIDHVTILELLSSITS